MERRPGAGRWVRSSSEDSIGIQKRAEEIEKEFVNKTVQQILIECMIKMQGSSSGENGDREIG